MSVRALVGRAFGKRVVAADFGDAASSPPSHPLSSRQGVDSCGHGRRLHPTRIDKPPRLDGFMARAKAKLSDFIALPKPDELSSRYGKAFERAVLTLLETKDAVAALRAFIESYGEPHSGAFNKIRMLIPWARGVREVSEAPLVVGEVGGRRLTAKADFLISYEDGRREIVELKSHILKRGEWRVKAEWSFAAKVMRMLYRKAGYDYPIRLIYFVEERGGVRPEQEVYMYPNDEKDDQHLLKALEERMSRPKPDRQQPR